LHTEARLKCEDNPGRIQALAALEKFKELGTLEKVAEHLGLSRQRVYQYMNYSEDITQMYREASKQGRSNRKMDLAAYYLESFKKLGSLKKVAEEEGVSQETVRKHIFEVKEIAFEYKILVAKSTEEKIKKERELATKYLTSYRELKSIGKVGKKYGVPILKVSQALLKYDDIGMAYKRLQYEKGKAWRTRKGEAIVRKPAHKNNRY
jgi:biotin operon repressor